MTVGSVIAEPFEKWAAAPAEKLVGVTAPVVGLTDNKLLPSTTIGLCVTGSITTEPSE